MNGDLSLGLELLLASFTILYIVSLLLPPLRLSGTEMFNSQVGDVFRMEKRSLLNQHVARR